MRRGTQASLLLAGLLLAGCKASDQPAAVGTTPAAPPVTTTTPATNAATTPPVATRPAGGTPATDPCQLVTADLARQLLGVAVDPAEPIAAPNAAACMYRATPHSDTVLLLVTTYAGSGGALLAQATAEHDDATDVSGVGEAAKVSRRDSVIGVVVHDRLFTLAMLRPDTAAASPAQIEAQLVAAARTVLARA
jgi:hypothetical protein